MNVFFLESVAYHWGPKSGLILYHFMEGSQPNTKFDILSMGFITPLENAVIVRIDSKSSNDFFELEIVSIYLPYAPNFVRWNITPISCVLIFFSYRSEVDYMPPSIWE